jgi:uncharacterized OB-fold protein
LVGNLETGEAVGLAGARCRACGEATLGRNLLCPNCGSEDVEPLALSAKGKVWTYTVVRYPPPGDYKGADPFRPFALGLVELPDGLRVLAPLACAPEEVRIGMDVVFQPRVRPDGVVQFEYALASEGTAQ